MAMKHRTSDGISGWLVVLSLVIAGIPAVALTTLVTYGTIGNLRATSRAVPAAQAQSPTRAPAQATSQATAQPQPSSHGVSAPFLLAGGAGQQSNPSAAGNTLVYSDCSTGKCTIMGLNLGTRQPFLIVPDVALTGLQRASDGGRVLSTDGSRVVWRDARTITDTASLTYLSDTNIMGASIDGKQPFTVASAPNQQTDPYINGNIVVWTDYRDARDAHDKEAGAIYMYDLSTNKETLVSNARSAQVRPVTNGKMIVWQDYRNEPDVKGFNSDIYAYDIASKQEFVISTAADQQSDPAISGNIVVWSDFRKGEDFNADLYGYDLGSKQEFLISGAPGSQLEPAISGNLVVWSDFRNDVKGTNSDIYGYDLVSKQEFPIYVGAGQQSSPHMAGNTVLWEDRSKGDADTEIMGATVPITPLAPPVALPGAGSQTFPETGKPLSGIFLDYWKSHGGLPQQGFPISNVIGEVSDLNGKTYTVQYFERAVFEYHPEEKPPYNVLLSQLGTFQYKKKYPTGAPTQTANNSPGSQLFPETGKRVGGKFLDYWKNHGGLAQQGYPISEEFTEVSDLNGKPYTVQYFERAVFEMHPENPAPYDVLLSQLGTFQSRAKYGSK